MDDESKPDTMPSMSRDRVLPVMRVSEEEEQILKAAALQDGLPLTTWLRRLALREARKQGVEAPAPARKKKGAAR